MLLNTVVTGVRNAEEKTKDKTKQEENNSSIVDENTAYILDVAEGFGKTFEAAFEVECTNDFEKIRTFRYNERATAIHVAQALSEDYKCVAVHAVFSHVISTEAGLVEKSLKSTVYLEECEDEDIVITENGIEVKEEE